MPELPEVETVRRGLEQAVVGRTVTAVEVTGARTVRRRGAEDLRDGLSGRVLETARRRGKYLAVGVGDEDHLVVHLRMTGQLLHVPDPTSPRQPHTHVVLRLDDSSELRFVDPRTFGEMFVSRRRGRDGLPEELDSLGIDPITEGLGAAQLAGLLARRRAALKVTLLNQALIAGIGNIYGDEICFRARLRPDRPSNGLSRAELRRLALQIEETLAEAIEARGSSLKDAQYKDLLGNPGEFQLQHAVYGRELQPCRRCGRPVVRSRLGGRSSFYCAHCQH